jgi:hypothetical protein
VGCEKDEFWWCDDEDLPLNNDLGLARFVGSGLWYSDVRNLSQKRDFKRGIKNTKTKKQDQINHRLLYIYIARTSAI